MRWYEYKMEVDDLHASDDLKAKLLAMQANAAETPGARSIPMPALSPAPLGSLGGLVHCLSRQ